ncbi:hypothetical protein AX16_000131 [Volvariella volvacea WC 439]|nr:hypothetical protein AX16_000131 [Volvariella volvacea WC 439]
MNKNPFVPQPSYTPQQPPLPPGPPPPQPQPDYSAYWAAAAQQQPAAHLPSPAVGTYNTQWTPPQPPRPPPEQSALYANYGYGTQQNHWQRQQQQQPPQPYHPAPPVVQPPPAQPGYNPYQPTAGYPQQYMPQAIPAPQPIVQPPYGQPQPPQQPFFSQHIPQQPQHHQRNAHPNQSQQLHPAKRQRFDGPNSNRHNQMQQHATPTQPQFQPPPAPPQGGYAASQSQGAARAGPSTGQNQAPMASSGNTNRNNANVGRGMSSNRGGRGGSNVGNRGGMGGKGRGGSSNNSGSQGSAFQAGGGGNRGGPSALRGHGSRGNFGGHNARRGGSFTAGPSGSFMHQGSFRGRHNAGRARHDGAAFGNREGPMSSSFSAGKKDENRRTLTDFKIVGLEIRELSWTWGTLPSTSSNIKTESVDSHTLPGSIKEEPMEDVSVKTEPSQQGAQASESRMSAEGNSSEVLVSAVDPKLQTEDVVAPNTRSLADTTNPPPSRIRIYFHTPVTPDDSRPIPHNAYSSLSVVPSDSRKGKRKKVDDDDADIEEGRVPPPPPQMSISEEHADGSVAPSVAETASEADWLMAATDGEEEAEAAQELDPDGEGDEDDMHVSHIGDAHEGDETAGSNPHEGEDTEIDGHHDTVNNTGTAVDISHPGLGSITSSAIVIQAEEPSAAPSSGDVSKDQMPVDLPGTAESQAEYTASSTSAVPATAIEEPSSTSVPISNDSPAVAVPSVQEEYANSNGLPDTQDTKDTAATPKTTTKSLQDVANAPTLLNVESQPMTGVTVEGDTTVILNGAGHTQEDPMESHATDIVNSTAERSLEPPTSPPSSNTLLSTSSTSTYGSSSKDEANKNVIKAPSANRLSISYAGGNRRLVIDAEIVDTLKLFRQEGRIEVAMTIVREGEDNLKGIQVEGLSETTKSYVPLQTILEQPESDVTVPPFVKLTPSNSLVLYVYLDTVRPLSEPKWAKTGDIQEWLKSMFGRMFWVAGEAAEGWEKKIQVVDPDPPPTIWTVLEGWAVNSPVGILTERQRFVKTHLTEIDNLLEILLRLVRGERATPFSQTAITAPSVSGPLLSALSGGSAHAAQQTHVSLAVLAMFRMIEEYALKALGDQGKSEVENRIGEIIRSLPSHLLYKSVDGIFKEWRVEKKGR